MSGRYEALLKVKHIYNKKQGLEGCFGKAFSIY